MPQMVAALGEKENIGPENDLSPGESAQAHPSCNVFPSA
jgi:hypothetical protein